MKKSLLAGLALLLPIAITVLILRWVVDLLTDPFLGPARKLLKTFAIHAAHHPHLATLVSRILVLLLLFLAILLLGLIGCRVIGAYCVRITQDLLLHIPFVRTIYRLSRDMTKALFSGEQKRLQQPTIVPFPSEQTYAIGFVTADVPAHLRAIASIDTVVFVPTSPHPISGFLLLMPAKDAQPIAMPVKEAFQLLISCGLSDPLRSE